MLSGNTLIKEKPSRYYKSLRNLSITIKSIKISIKQNSYKLLVDNQYIPSSFFVVISEIYFFVKERGFYFLLKNFLEIKIGATIANSKITLVIISKMALEVYRL